MSYINWSHIVYCFVELQHAKAEDILDLLLNTEGGCDENRTDTEVRRVIL